MRRWWHRRGEDPLVCRDFVELVTDYLEGALPDGERVRFEAHLSECDGCDAYLAQMRTVVVALGEQPPPPAPADPHTRETLLRAFRDLRS